MTEIQRSDARARRLAIRVTAVALILGAAGILVIDHYETAIHGWLEANVDWLIRHTWAVFLAGLVIVLPILAFSAYLFMVGHRIARAARYPAPGHAVVRDTPVVTGRRAIVRGRSLQGLSALLALCSLAIPVTFWQMFTMLGRIQ